jgi:transformation/transcription domain-associated protein
MYMTEILPATSSGSPIITSTEAVPFRLTPNMQHFITKTGVEGTVTAVLTALSRSLTLPEFDLSGTLTIFLRDEVNSIIAQNGQNLHNQVVFWQSAYKQDPRPDTPNATLVYTNAEKFIRRAETIGFLGENKDRVSLIWYKGRDLTSQNPPAIHTTVSLISAATSPSLLCQMPESYQAWF